MGIIYSNTAHWRGAGEEAKRTVKFYENKPFSLDLGIESMETVFALL